MVKQTITSTSRENKDGKGSDPNAKRNAGGLAYEEARYVPAQVKKGEKDVAEFYRFNAAQFEFLRVYSQNGLDLPAAAKAAGVTKGTADNWMQQEKFKAEVDAIYDVYRANLRMTSEHASARLIKLMNKFEKDYDTGETLKDKASMAKALSSMADTYLKATGTYKGDKGVSEGNIVINIDLTGESKKMKKAEVIDG